MYWDRIEVNWQRFKGQVGERWARIEAQQLDRIRGRRDALSELIQDTYGVTHDEAERQLSEWQRFQKLEDVA